MKKQQLVVVIKSSSCISPALIRWSQFDKRNSVGSTTVTAKWVRWMCYGGDGEGWQRREVGKGGGGMHGRRERERAEAAEEERENRER